MNKYFLMFTAFLGFLQQGRSCDVCGCGVRDGSFTMGYAQSIPSNMFLLGFQNIQFYTTVPNNSDGSFYEVQDRIQRIPIQYIHHVNNRFQINFSSSFQTLQRKNAYNNGKNWSKTSPGDLLASLNYKVLDNRKDIFAQNRWLWMVGLTTKLPSGYYQTRDENKRLIPMHLQASNGSYSQGAQSFLTVKRKHWGIMSQYQLLYHATNEVGYQQGFSQSLQLGMNRNLLTRQKHTLISTLAYRGQFVKKDKEYGQTIATTGGQIHWAQLQLEWIYKNIYFLLQHNRPLLVKIPDYSPVTKPMTQIRLGWIIDPMEKEKKKPN